MVRAAHHCPFRWRDLYSCGPRKQFCSAPKAALILFPATSTCGFQASIRWKNRPMLRGRIRPPQFQRAAWDVFHQLRGIVEVEVQLVGSGRFSFRRRTRANHAEVAENPQLVNAKACAARAALPTGGDAARCESCFRPTTIPPPAYTPPAPSQIFGTRPCGPPNLQNKLSTPSNTDRPCPGLLLRRAEHLWVNCGSARWELILREITPPPRLHFAAKRIGLRRTRGSRSIATPLKSSKAARLQSRPFGPRVEARGRCARTFRDFHVAGKRLS
jgi:hypothetical protein